MIHATFWLALILAALALGAGTVAAASGDQPAPTSEEAKVLATYGPTPLTADHKPATPLLQWKPLELSFTAAKLDDNPYLHLPTEKKNDLLRVTFTGTAGAAKGQSLTLIGFWDGAQTWKVRFAPPLTGDWHFATDSPDPGLNAKTGDFPVRSWTPDELQANPLGHGFIRVCTTGPRPGRYFEHADSTPFLWIADTWWNWGNPKAPLEEFEKVVDDRAAKGFTLGQLYVHGWGHSLLDGDGTTLDLARLRRLDALIAYANAKGLVVMLSPWWGGKDLAHRIGPDRVHRLTRYLIHRYAAFNVLWILASEYNLYDYGGLGLKFWEEYGAMIQDEDPYHRAVSVHPTPPGWDGGKDAPQWSTADVLQDQPWLDYNQSQTGHGKPSNEMVPQIVAESYAKKPAKPIVVTETWYEFIEGNAPARDIRFAAWSAILSGAAGHTYGGGHVWIAHTPASPAAPMPWPLDQSFTVNTLDYSGAVSIGHLAKFFQSIPWWKLEPHPELVLDYPQKFCAALPGQQYVLYLRYGSGVTLDLSATPNTFQSRWFNPVTAQYTPGPTIPGNAKPHFSPPPVKGVDNLNQQDWVLLITKSN